MYEIVNYHSKIAAIRAYCDNADLRMVLHDQDEDLAYTDGNCIFLPMPKPEWEQDRWTKWEFIAYHEAGHNRKPTNDIWELCDTEKLWQSDMQWYLNIVDDFRQEFIHTFEYSGRDQAVDLGRGIAALDTIAALRKHGSVPNESTKDKISGPLFVWTDRLRQEFQPSMKGMHQIIYDMLPDDMKASTDKLAAYDDELYSCATAMEELELIRKILTEVFNFTPEQSAAAEDGVGKDGKDSKGKKRKGKGKPDRDGEKGEGEGEGDGDTAAGEGDGTENGKSSVEGKVRWEDIVPDNHDRITESHADLSINYDGHATAGGFFVHPEPTINIPTEQVKRRVHIENVTSLANRVRKLLQVKSQKRWQHNETKGKISSRSLHNIITPKDDEYKIFKTKTSAITLDASVTLLIDMSGSMGGEKWTHAVNAAYNMYCSLSKLRISTEIIGFQSHSNDVFTIFKEFDEKLSESRLALRFQNVSPGSSNEDAAALLFAANRLIRRKTTGKHLIVFSDGQPAGYTHDSMSNAQRVARMIERTKIDLIGIGILDDTVSKIYKKHVVIRKASQLEDALMKIIQTRFV